MDLTHRIFMKYGVYGMNRIWSMMKRSLLIGLLAAILPFFMNPGFDVSAEDYIASDPPETINLFGDILHPVYIGTLSNHTHIYTTQESIDNLLAYDHYDQKNWDLYIICVPGTAEGHEDMVASITKKADRWVTWLPAASRTIWGTGAQEFVSDDYRCISYDEEYYNLEGEIIGFQRADGEDEDPRPLREYEPAKMITDFINRLYNEHQKEKYSKFIN